MARTLLLAAAVVATGCVPTEDDAVFFDERFEDPEAELRERWAVGGTVELVTTNHPGEHAARLIGATSIAHRLQITAWDEYSDGHWVEYTSDCPGAPDLRLELVADGWRIVVDLPPPGPPGVFERVHAVLPPLPIGSNLSELAIRSSGARGPCTIDNVRVLLPSAEYAW